MRVVVTWAACFLLAVQPPAVGQANSTDNVTEITGVVTDGSGKALEGLQVVLEASSLAFDFKRLQRVPRDTTTRTTQTDADGRYRLRWYPSQHFNHFELAVGMTVRVPDGETFYTLERLDLGAALAPPGPVVVDAVVADTAFLNRYRRFVGSLDSDQEQEVFDRMGIPAKIDRMQLATHEETTWWYFEAGRAYRFEDGRLAEEIDFEPVIPFDESEN